MKQTEIVITKDSRMTIGLVISLITGVGAFFGVYFHEEANAQATVKLEKRMDDKDEKITALITQVAVMQGELHEVNQKLDRIVDGR